MSTDRELLELAAKACGYTSHGYGEMVGDSPCLLLREADFTGLWAPLTDDGDRYRLAQKLGLAIDFEDCTVWKRLRDGRLIQEYWGGDWGDEAHAVVRAAAAIGKAMP